MKREEDEIGNLKYRRWVEAMDTDERERRARDEDADLVDEGVGGVEGTVRGKWGGGEGKEEGWGDALVDGVFGNVDEEEGEHAVRDVSSCECWDR